MLQQALAATGLLVVLVMAADMLLIALHQRGWLARWAEALRGTPREERARARRAEAARLQRGALAQFGGMPAAWIAASARHNQP